MISEQEIDDVLIDDYFERLFYFKINNESQISNLKKSWFKCSDIIHENCIFISNIPKDVDESSIFELFSKSFTYKV